MNKLEIAKKATTIVVGLGASKIAGTIIKTHVQPETVIDKVTVTAGAVVIGMMASEASKTFTETKFDEYVAAFNDLRKQINEAKNKQATQTEQ